MLVSNYQDVRLIQVVIALGFHLFPFRTEKLSPTTPMVLRKSGRVGSRRFRRESPQASMLGGSLFFVRRGVSKGVFLKSERGERRGRAGGDPFRVSLIEALQRGSGAFSSVKEVQEYLVRTSR